MLFDVDGREVREHEGADEFGARVVVLACKDRDGIGGANALVATARIGHDRNGGTGHAGIAGRRGGRKDVRENVVAHDAAAHGAGEGFAEAVSVVAFERTL